MMGFGMFGGLGLLIMLLFWGFLIFLGVWLVKALFSSSTNNQAPPDQRGKSPNALEILAQRYARGEITREQYEIMKQDLS